MQDVDTGSLTLVPGWFVLVVPQTLALLASLVFGLCTENRSEVDWNYHLYSTGLW